MAKKQSRRSVSLSKTTYERLKAYCELNDLSMSQFVEGRIGDYLGRPSRKDAARKDDDRANRTGGGIFTF
jgi:hypothetical protein